jgi:hypothetical protein
LTAFVGALVNQATFLASKIRQILRYAYLNEKMMPSPWPMSMIINYNEPA